MKVSSMVGVGVALAAAAGAVYALYEHTTGKKVRVDVLILVCVHNTVNSKTVAMREAVTGYNKGVTESGRVH